MQLPGIGMRILKAPGAATQMLVVCWLLFNVAVIGLVTGGGYAYTPLTPDAITGDVDGAVTLTATDTETSPAGPAAASGPSSRYVAIDRANNRLYVHEGATMLLEAVVSTGSGHILRETSGRERTWTFDTPTGVERVLSKRRDPTWIRPDWAFVEKGSAIPRETSARAQSGALGAYALDLGDGYMIHGTPFDRLLGRSITHGCIRMGADDLERTFDLVPIGTSVYVFPEIDPAPDGTYTLALTPDFTALELMRDGRVLRTYAVSGVDRGSLRAPVLRGGQVDPMARSVWAVGRTDPAPVFVRRVEFQPEVERAPDLSGTVAWVPPPPDSAMPAPAAFTVGFDEGLTIVIQEDEVADRAFDLRTLRAAPARFFPNRNERGRIRIRMPAEQAGELYRSLPTGTTFVLGSTGRVALR